MATPVTIYYESNLNATKEDRKRSLTPSFIDGIIDKDAQANLLRAVEDSPEAVSEWIDGWFAKPKPVSPGLSYEELNFKDELGFRPFLGNPLDLPGLPSDSLDGILSLDSLDYSAYRNVINALAFHANISETHTAVSEITKYPTQAGFEISNHAIRKNRVIEIEAIITNTLINAVGSRQLNYGLDNSLIVFEALESLVNSGTVCQVSTNLGLYWPVVFTKFRTKQELGMVDSMKFILVGEEVIVQDTVNKTSPKQLNFTRITGSQCDKLASDKARDGFLFQCSCNQAAKSTLDAIYGVNPGVSSGATSLQNVLNSRSTSRSAFIASSLDNNLGRGLINSTKISQAAVMSNDLSEDNVTGSNLPPNMSTTNFILGRDFQVEATNTAGKPYTVTYKVLSYDYTARKHKYEVHTNDLDVYVPASTASAEVAGVQSIGSILPDTAEAIIGGSPRVSNCLLGGAANLACEAGQDYIDSVIGKVRETIYGAITDVVNMGGIDGSDSLLGMTLDCVSAEVYGEGVGFEEAGDLLADDIDNATNRIMGGAVSYGGEKAAQGGNLIRRGLDWKPTPAEKLGKMSQLKIPVDFSDVVVRT